MREKQDTDEASHGEQGRQTDLFRDIPSVSVLGVRIHTLSLETFLALTEQTIARQQRAIIAYANVHGLNLAYKTPWFRAFLNRSDIVFCDGFGVKWGARLLGYEIPRRFTPPDWLDSLATQAAHQERTLYLLGSRAGVAEKAAARFQQRTPGLLIAGTHHGFFDKNRDSTDNRAVVQAVNAAAPDVLMVGFGMPLQEQWLMENWDDLRVNVALTVGAAFDYLTGEVRRGPRWMTDHGLEWLSRLIIEPRRLWRRYLLGNPLFLWRILRQRLHAIEATS
jgi:N-acetylglucosaminyldiphosphoundecaprenol N-acetyl-beta-D-mannosaminyltransferase